MFAHRTTFVVMPISRSGMMLNLGLLIASCGVGFEFVQKSVACFLSEVVDFFVVFF